MVKAAIPLMQWNYTKGREIQERKAKCHLCEPVFFKPLALILSFGMILWLICFLTAVSVSAQCVDRDVWGAFPTIADLKNVGVLVNDQLKTDAGPTLNKNNTKTYIRRWQGGSSSRGVSVSLTIHPDKKLAADEVQKYGDGLTKSRAGAKVDIGDLGFKTDDQMRPYYMVQKGCMVVSFYTSTPRRTMVGDQDPVVNAIVGKLSSLSCCQAGTASPPPPTNNCPIIKDAGFVPVSPTPKDIVAFTATAVDKDGDNINYTWKIQDLNRKVIKTMTGSRAQWRKPPPGNYLIRLLTKDSDPSCIDWFDKKMVVLENPAIPNQPPVIRISVSPNPALTNQDVIITAVVNDPDGDKIWGGWGHTSVGGVAGGRYPNLQRAPGTGGPRQPVKTRSGDTFVWRCRVKPGLQKMTFGAEDVRGGKSRKTASFVVVDPSGPLDVTLVKTPDKSRVPRQPLSFNVIDNAASGDNLTYAWWVDGKRENRWTGEKASWANPTVGNHSVKVQAWKKTGETDTDKIYFEITETPTPPSPPKNTPPTVKISRLTKRPVVGKAIHFRAKVTDPDNKDMHSFTWRIRGKLIGTGPGSMWKTDAPGAYTVVAIVSDGAAKASDSHHFKVEDPTPGPLQPPPPVRHSIIKKADFFHPNVIHGYGQATNFNPGEEIGLRIEIVPSARRHQIVLNWFNPRREKVRSRIIEVKGGNLGQIRLLEDFLSTDTADPPGAWTVEILVDGRFNRKLPFSLTRPGSVITRPGTTPSEARPAYGSGNRPSSSTGGEWKNAF